MSQKLRDFFLNLLPVSTKRFTQYADDSKHQIDEVYRTLISEQKSKINAIELNICDKLEEQYVTTRESIANAANKCKIDFEKSTIPILQEQMSVLMTVQTATDRIYQMISAIASNQQNMEQFSREVLQRTEQEMVEIFQTLRAFSEQLNILINDISSKGKVYYHCDHEVRSIEDGGFYELQSSPAFLEKYCALIRGLDDESIETVNRILSRHVIVRGRSEEYIDLFSKEEREIIVKQRQYFYANLVRLTPDVFACGKYLLAAPEMGMGFSETTIFVDHAGFEKLDHPERIRKKNILDLGAFIGDSALILAEFTEEKVYAFEPGCENYQSLIRTVELNHNLRIIPIHAGIGSEKGTAEIPAYFSMGLKLAPQHEQKQEGMNIVPVVSIDDFVSENEIEVGLIKVDIEGYEMEFLKGAERTIREQRPALLLSIYHNASDFFGIKPLLESWNLGYHFKIHKEVNEHIHYDTMLIAEAE